MTTNIEITDIVMQQYGLTYDEALSLLASNPSYTIALLLIVSIFEVMLDAA